MFSKNHLIKPEITDGSDVSEESKISEHIFAKIENHIKVDIDDTVISIVAISATKAVDIAKNAAIAASLFYRKIIINFYRYNKGNKIVNIPYEIILNTYQNSNVCRGWVENRCNNDVNCPYGFHTICSKFKNNGDCECGGYQATRCPFGAHVNLNYDNRYYHLNSIDQYLLLLKKSNKR